LQSNGLIQLSSEYQDSDEERNRNPLQAPGCGFTCRDPGPESVRVGTILKKAEDRLDEKNKDHERTAGGQNQRPSIGWEFVSWSGKRLSDGARTTLSTTTAQCAVEFKTAARTDSQTFILK
jgi:hypothetical protein